MLLKKLKAISYVEIILVLMIVGVISSISIPTLKRHSQQTELGPAAQKAYLTLNEAIDNAVLVKGPMRNWSGTNTFGIYIASSLNAIDQVKSDTKKVTTKDKFVYECLTDTASADNDYSIEIKVDVNGANNPPNSDGKDIHYFTLRLGWQDLIPKKDSVTEKLAANGWKFNDELWLGY